MSTNSIPFNPGHPPMKAERNIRSLVVTIGLTAISLSFCAPAVITEVFSWIPQGILSRISYRSPLWSFEGLCEIATAAGGWVYLSGSFILNILLSFRRQVPVWLKLLLWVLFVIAIFGVMHMESEIRQIRRVAHP